MYELTLFNIVSRKLSAIIALELSLPGANLLDGFLGCYGEYPFSFQQVSRI